MPRTFWCRCQNDTLGLPWRGIEPGRRHNFLQNIFSSRIFTFHFWIRILISILALIVPGERPRQEMARKGSAGRTRSKFFPNGWTNQNQERDLNQAINGQSEGSNQPRSSQSPKARESRSEPTNQNARINKSVPVTPDQTTILSPDPRPLTPDGPKNENEMLSSSLPSSFFHKSKL